MGGWLGGLLVVSSVVLWIYTARRVSVDERLTPQGRHIGSLAVFFAPPLALLYWLSLLGGAPFWIDDESHQSDTD